MTATRDSFVSGIVLAAGTSSRLGRPKQLLELAGKPVLQHVLETLRSSPVDEIVVVLGHRAEEIGAAVVPDVTRTRVAINPDFHAGQSTSLRAGLSATSDRSEAAVILLGDQPGISREAIRAVVEAWMGGRGPVVQASYGGTPAHPVLFDRSVWPDLEQAVGDEGARSILASNPGWRSLVEIDAPLPLDIDTEADYARVRSQFQSR